MKRLSLLREESFQDDQVLETDIMRFMAIIGFVFWIIFALVKSMPLKMPKTSLPSLQTPAGIREKPYSRRSRTPFEGNKEIQKGKESSHKKTISERSSKMPGPQRKRPLGLYMQFYSLDDLLALMAAHRVRLFYHARAAGFDLFFEGQRIGDTVKFKNTDQIPSRLWEIKSGSAHGYFFSLIGRTYPAIRSFPIQQVLVSFADKGLRKHVEERLSQLEQTGKNGVLSITRDCNIVYTPWEEQRQSKKQP